MGSSGSSGVHTFSERQSSLCTSVWLGSAGLVIPGTPTRWGAMGPNLDASRTPVHASAGTGGRQRSSPTGALAYGMPAKDH